MEISKTEWAAIFLLFDYCSIIGNETLFKDRIKYVVLQGLETLTNAIIYAEYM